MQKIEIALQEEKEEEGGGGLRWRRVHVARGGRVSAEDSSLRAQSRCPSGEHRAEGALLQGADFV